LYLLELLGSELQGSKALLYLKELLLGPELQGSEALLYLKELLFLGPEL